MSTRYEALLSKIHSGEVAILDCGTSTELERRGATMDDRTWSARVSIESFDVLVETHQAYIDARVRTLKLCKIVKSSKDCGKNMEQMNATC
jgi:S-methylmethionine-dependent homocysteine/selenocysteine methylase